MTAYAFTYSLHLLAALIWVGGMFFAWMILRPAAASVLPAADRLRLWADVLRRFFNWVWGALLLLPLSGFALLHLGFPGLGQAPRYVQVMIGLFLAMLALFLRLQLLLLPELRRAIAAEDWPAGAGVLLRVRRVVGFNLLIGMALVAVVGARPSF